MAASSRAPRFLLCLFLFLLVLASAQDFQGPDTPERGILKLTVTITDHLNPCSPILAEEGNTVLVIVNNVGTDSVSIYPNVVYELDSTSGRFRSVVPLLRIWQAGRTEPANTLLHTAPASQTSNYRFKATRGSYNCKEKEDSMEDNKGMLVVIVRHQEPERIGGPDVAAAWPSEDQYIARIDDNRQHESTVDVIHHPGVLNGLAVPPGNDLVTAKNEAPGIDDLFDLTDDYDGQDLPRAIDIIKPNACEHPTTLITCRAINWSSEEHRRTCLARIVNTVYCGDNNVTALQLSLKNTGFSLLEEPLKDGEDMYAAIYKYEGRAHEDAPDIIVAFRGTEWCFKWKSAKDTLVNCLIGVNAVEYAYRFKQAYEKVKELTDSEHRVWLTGHSQGASLALHVGRQAMLKKEIDLPTFAFNPPLAIVCWFPHSAKKFIGTMTPSSRDQSVKLSKWTPVLYVHKRDFLFCRCVISCLKHPTKVDKWVTQLPSAMLCEHSGQVQGGRLERWLGPHSLEQWFKPNRQLKLNCQAVKSTDGEDNLNCLAVKSNEEDCEDDIEAQMSQNPEAPSQDQHAPPTGPSTAKRIAKAAGIFGGIALAITAMIKFIPRMNPFNPRRRRSDRQLPRTSHISDHGWWRWITRRDRKKQM